MSGDNITVNGIDPLNYNTVTAFKSAVYATIEDKGGVPSWKGDMKLDYAFKRAHGEVESAEAYFNDLLEGDA